MPENITCNNCMKLSNCFSELMADELDLINNVKTQVIYNKGEILCKQGSFSSSILYISKGLVKVYLENRNKKITNLRILKAQDFIGLSSVYINKTYNYSAEALNETEVCLIEKQGFRKLLETNAAFASSVIKKYCSIESQLFNKMHSISYKQMHGRLADVLLYLDVYKDEKIYQNINRKDIAYFACMSKESTIKLLGEFYAEGIIELDGKQIHIKDKGKLESISITG